MFRDYVVNFPTQLVKGLFAQQVLLVQSADEAHRVPYLAITVHGVSGVTEHVSLQPGNLRTTLLHQSGSIGFNFDHHCRSFRLAFSEHHTSKRTLALVAYRCQTSPPLLIHKADDVTSAQPKIVVVEDDLVVQLIITEALEDMDAEVLVFATADAALEHVVRSDAVCDLLVADHGVSGALNGSKLATVFRSRWPETPIVITSGYELDPDTLPLGVVFVPKPWTIEQLTEAVARLL